MSDFKKRGIRPIWLASYPRSGNTFLRIVLESLFGLSSYSVYYVEGQKSRDPSADPLGQANKLPENWRDLLSEADNAERILIKTHEPPEDNAPTIYLVRDGRSAIHSYFHYHRDFGLEQPTLTDIIIGACAFGGWSDHYKAWLPQARANTLFLRYEDLVERPEDIISPLAQFLQREPTGRGIPRFEELKQKDPKFFRRGQNQEFVCKWSHQQIGLFNALHGSVMNDLGYVLTEAPEPGAAEVAEIAARARRLHGLYLQQRAALETSDAHFRAVLERVNRHPISGPVLSALRWLKNDNTFGSVF